MRIDGPGGFPPDIPYEDNHQTKEIIRMELLALSNMMRSGEKRPHIDHQLKEMQHHIDLLGHKDVQETFSKLRNLIEHHYPISEHSDWDVLEKMRSYLNHLDDKTLY